MRYGSCLLASAQEILVSDNSQNIFSADYSAARSYNKTRIVGGDAVADPSKYPWMAALVYSDTEEIYDGQFCGGTLVAPEWVVTAAHCVCEKESIVPVQVSDMNVVLGMVDLKATPDTYERIEVAQIIVHPGYDPVWTDNDVALIKLERPSAQLVIDHLETERSDPLPISSEAVMATTIGWGETKAQIRSYPSQLQEVDLLLVPNKECAAFFEDGEITENMLCAGFPEGGKDSCFGDSGGPLVTLHPDGGYLLTGIVSWGDGCAQPNSYGVYTRISRVSQWILQQTGSPVILTDGTPTTIYSGADILVFGSQGINNLTVQSGSHARLVNFPGINLITIQGSSSLFSVSRSGGTVTFKDETNDTVVVMPATKNIQFIVFDDLTALLKIEGGKLMLGSQMIGIGQEAVTPG